MNAVVFTYGWSKGGRDGARLALTDFWRRISHAALMGPLQPSWLDRVTHNHSLQFSPAFLALDMISRLFSPYEFNPFNQNPLRDVLEASVDFESLRASDCPIKLFLSATNVRSGKVKVFERNEICPDRTLASACLPFLFQAVEIDGEHYWDGGYMGNPALFPLIYNCESRDIVVVHINPLYREKLPRTATEIMNRINEISFNSSLMREMRAISFVTKLIEDGRVNGDGLRHLLIHSISAEEEMGKLGVASKLNGDWEFLTHLRDIGRQHAEAWLKQNFDRIGKEFHHRHPPAVSLRRKPPWRPRIFPASRCRLGLWSGRSDVEPSRCPIAAPLPRSSRARMPRCSAPMPVRADASSACASR